MVNKNDEPFYVSHTPSNVVDIQTVREALRLPTSLTAIIGKLAGGIPEVVRPGFVSVAFPSNSRKSVSIRMINIYALEAKAYINEGLEVPEYVYADMKRWEKENRGL